MPEPETELTKAEEYKQFENYLWSICRIFQSKMYRLTDEETTHIDFDCSVFHKRINRTDSPSFYNLDPRFSHLHVDPKNYTISACNLDAKTQVRLPPTISFLQAVALVMWTSWPVRLQGTCHRLLTLDKLNVQDIYKHEQILELWDEFKLLSEIVEEVYTPKKMIARYTQLGEQKLVLLQPTEANVDTPMNTGLTEKRKTPD